MDCSGSHNPEWLELWAKTKCDKTNQNSRDRVYQPLLYHMLDVAAVAGLVWDHCLIPQLRERLERSLGTDTRAEVVFLAGAHDIGKASPGFQNILSVLSEHCGLRFSYNDQNRPHGFISAHVLKEALGSGPNAAVLAQTSGGHHGVFPRSAELRMGRDTLGNNCWKTARQELLQEFSKTVGFPLREKAQPRSEITDAAVVPVLAGLISVVDWIGSNQDFFPCVAECGKPAPIRASDYWRNAQAQAQIALKKLGWLPAVAFAAEARFDTVFGGLTPNTLQSVAIELASKQTSPYLMIVEAPMGQGKTEAALYAADMAMCKHFARGMYIAMPTQATGNAMFKRVLDEYLKKRGHKGKLNLQLVHSDALLAQMAQVKEGEIPDFRPKNIADEDDVEAQSWFAAKKRPLLAPFGVGTIDQSLLSVLQTKHWFVRLFGLVDKVVIFDEVHAYDAYMSTILERLLHWLAEIDCTVILLSATLPEAKRRALAKAYSGRHDGEYKRYPRITLAGPRHYPNTRTDTIPECSAIPMDKSRNVRVQFGTTDLPTLTGSLRQRLKHGGCAAVICNTVDTAIEVYKHLRDNLEQTECMLFHARTLQMWRREREQEVLLKFGKGEKQADGTYPNLNPHRPTRAVLVATQVIEQSLDLDFDLMVSEIAPIDLLLQRCGRLHRHTRLRPTALETPQFILLCDAEATGPPPESFGKSIEFVYDRYILLRTWFALRHRTGIEVPTEIEALVETVYGESSLDCCGEDWSMSLAEALAGFEVATDDSIGHARHLLIRQPDDPTELIERFNRELEDDDNPATDTKIRAATREGEPSIKAVFLVGNEKLPKATGIKETRWLLDRSVSISQKSLFPKLLALKVPAAWESNVHLRHCRLVEAGKTKGINVRVSQDLGLEIL